MDYKNKYLKYKNKYLKLKNQLGGVAIGISDIQYSSNKKLAEERFERDKREKEKHEREKLAKEAREKEKREREEYDREPVDIETSEEPSSDVEDTINNIMKCYNCRKEIKAQPNNKINIYNNKLYCENCYNKLI